MKKAPFGSNQKHFWTLRSISDIIALFMKFSFNGRIPLQKMLLGNHQPFSNNFPIFSVEDNVAFEGREHVMVLP